MEHTFLAPLLVGVLVGAAVPALVVSDAPAAASSFASDLVSGGEAAPEGPAAASHDASGSDHDHGARAGAMGGDHPVRIGTDEHPWSQAQHRHAWPAAEGKVPTRSEAQSGFEEHQRIEILDDGDFTPANGVAGGSGTAEDPYVIEHVYVRDDLYIADTSSYFIVREVYVAGQLTLNWVGDRVHVHHSYIRDLRVNENVPRTGDDTMGLIERNEIGFVGQIRHSDGIFRHNTVGPHPGGWMGEASDGLVEWPWMSEKVIQLDGMHGGDFYGNEIFGWVEIKLHGHHHASCFACLQHPHANESAGEGYDHTERYHMMSFHDNRIVVEESPVALIYTDTNHAGDDRQAASEDVDALNRDHVHYTEVHLWRNELVGGGLLVDIFNADDENHDRENPGWLYIEGNSITLQAPDDRENMETIWRRGHLDGIHVTDVKELEELVIRNNQVTFEGDYTDPDASFPTGWLTSWMEPRPPAGIRLDGFATSDVVIEGNRVTGTHWGVKAEHLHESVTWTLVSNTFEDVEEPVYWDDSVESQPERE